MILGPDTSITARQTSLEPDKKVPNPQQSHSLTDEEAKRAERGFVQKP